VARRDSFGNALGGIRLAEHAVPIAVNDGVNSGAGFCFLYGSHIDFDVATLAALYPRHSDYVSAFREATRESVEAGFILPGDAEASRDQAERSIIGHGDPCGATCRATQAFGVLTQGFLIEDGDKLVRHLDEAALALASGDGQATAKKARQDYQKARKLLEKYSDDLHKLEAKGQVPPSVFADLLAGVTALLADVDELLAG
jgi:hypothetical protein